MKLNYLPIREEWLAAANESAQEPDIAIIDAHHHFYERPGWNYLDHEYLADVSQGHRIVASVHMQALTRYRTDGDEALRPVGETEYVQHLAERHVGGVTKLARGMVAYADLRLGTDVKRVLQAHLDIGGSRVKGMRHLVSWDGDSSLANPLSVAPPGLLLDSRYREGYAQLAKFGLSYDAWLFFPQLPELLDLAKTYPDVPVIINHCGGIVRIGTYANRHDEVYANWRKHMLELAKLRL
jgi:L-fuconolactonase